MTSGVSKMAAVDPRWPERLPVKVNKVEVGREVRGHSIRRPSRPAVSWNVWRERCRLRGRWGQRTRAEVGGRGPQ